MPDAVVISQVVLAKIIGRSERSVRTAPSIPRADNWIEIRQLGNAATVNAYIVNDRVAWTGKRDGIRYRLFSAAVVVSEEEQPDRDTLGHQDALRRIPDLLPGEAQLPSGEGLPPRNASSREWSRTCPRPGGPVIRKLGKSPTILLVRRTTICGCSEPVSSAGQPSPEP